MWSCIYDDEADSTAGFRTWLFLNISLTAVGLIHALMFCVGDEFKSYTDLQEKIHAFERTKFM